MLQHRGTDSVNKCHYINNYCWFGILTLAILMTISVSEKLFVNTVCKCESHFTINPDISGDNFLSVIPH